MGKAFRVEEVGLWSERCRNKAAGRQAREVGQYSAKIRGASCRPSGGEVRSKDAMVRDAELTSFACSYTATLYPDFKTVPVPLSVSTIPAFEDYYLALPSPTAVSPSLSSPPRAHIYICTHGTRDCRCGDLGEPLYQALVKEARRRKLGGEMGDPEAEPGVLIARVAHVGGHKFAGNALVYRDDGRADW